jgi:hypothetical protein
MNGGRLLGRACAPDQPIRFRSGFGGDTLQLFGVSDLIILARFERQGVQARRAIPRLFLTHAHHRARGGTTRHRHTLGC